ncbi:MAG: 30S ribosomal protein S6 [bacterium]|nr:30S ribosomal protein S6 [bacterium]
MADYELALVTSDDLPEKDKKELLSTVEKKVALGEGKVGNIEEWPRKSLAYPINKKTTANFTFVEFSGDASVPAAIRRELNLSENILRSLLIKKEAVKAKAKDRRARIKKAKEDLN